MREDFRLCCSVPIPVFLRALQFPAELSAVAQGQRATADHFDAFIEDTFTKEDGAAVSLKLMRAEYEAWALNNAEDKVPLAGFGSHLIGKGFEYGFAYFDKKLGYTHAKIKDDPGFSAVRVKRGRAWLGGSPREVSRGIMLGKSLD